MTQTSTPAQLQADIAAFEFIFTEFSRTMEPAALLKVLNYLLRNAQREATEADSPLLQARITRLQTLLAQVQPEAERQITALKHEKSNQRREKARHRAENLRNR
ncbi:MULTISPECIES: hypothetical protein [unclassified Stenotrophomonas]|uniref:hypothetical protein n=1 Tax=unclassified Stenotrophomonas TaxID=196198 RepID=UPI00249B3BAC|nr:MULTISPECIES: hypothetical protein [unclassified Stenotrophomonas]